MLKQMTFLKLRTSLLTVVILCLSSFASAENSNQTLKKQMLAELDIIRNTFDVRYALADWKKQFAQWELDLQIAFAKNRILASPQISLKEFRRIVCDFFNSTRDYHVGVHFFSTEAAYLNLRIKSAEGRYFITWIDRSLANTGLSLGDEVLQFDGRPIDEVVLEIRQREFGNSTSPTDQALAEMRLTKRNGALGHPIPVTLDPPFTKPKGAIATLVLRKKGSNEASLHELTWEYLPEKISDGPYKAEQTVSHSAPIAVSSPVIDKPLLDHALFSEEMQAAFNPTLQSGFDGTAKLIGNRKGPLPPLGKVTWRSDSEDTFHAYLFSVPEREQVIGYLRIHTYLGETRQAREFAKLIRLFEEQSDLLVIDQVDNGGGNLFYTYGLASMLSPTPLSVPAHQITLTQEDAYRAVSNVEILESFNFIDIIGPEDTLFGYPLDKEFLHSLVDHFHEILDEWNGGHFITKPIYPYGIAKLTINPLATYSKPILVLINELDFSAADLLPAILQDNKRATIFGTRTSGAGGLLRHDSHPNRFGISHYSYTGSMMMRAAGAPIENLGVTPDIPYEVTAEDLQNGYQGYKKAVQQAIQKLIPDPIEKLGI